MGALNKDSYQNDAVKYLDFGNNLKLSLEALLRQNNIQFQDVQMRIKSFDSAEQKMQRKNYKSIEDFEDICGLRIICFYLDDIEKIERLLLNEFQVIEQSNKEDDVRPDQFWYRSSHYIVKLRDEWIKTPNYKDYTLFKAEIQVRTILMHAWDEIEHQLNYKNPDAVPNDLRRIFAQLSAVLTLADDQFSKLRMQKEEYISKVDKPSFDLNLPVDTDTLQAFIKHYFPDRRHPSGEDINRLVSQLKSARVTFKAIIDGYNKIRLNIPDIEKDLSNIFPDTMPYPTFGQAGIVRIILDLTNVKFFEKRKELELSLDIIKFVEKWRGQLKLNIQ